LSLRHAILTSLLEQPSTGLELTRRFDGSLRFYWSATHQQVYRELGKLAQDRLVKATIPQPPTRGTPKRYVVMAAGRQELARWVSAHEEPRPIREALLVRLRASAIVGDSGLADELLRHQLHHQAQHALYQDLAARDFAQGANTKSERIHELILTNGIAYEQYWIDWLTHARDVLEELTPAPSSRQNVRSD
jgi:DNA-binding PadR family transcriptional regulator